MERTQQLKLLKTKRIQLTKELKDLMQTKTNINQRITKIDKELTEVNTQLNRLTHNIIVSEHAILRYLERIMKVDIKSIKQKILNPNTEAIIRTIKSGKVPLENDAIAIVKQNVIVSIIPSKNNENNTSSN